MDEAVREFEHLHRRVVLVKRQISTESIRPARRRADSRLASLQAGFVPDAITHAVQLVSVSSHLSLISTVARENYKPHSKAMPTIKLTID